jgi:hypothetical protein
MSNNSPQSSPEPFAILASTTQDAPRQEPDCEDRRWQLEWARRNVEDWRHPFAAYAEGRNPLFRDTTGEDATHRRGGCRVQEQIHG